MHKSFFKRLSAQTVDDKIKVRNNEKKTINFFKRFYNKYFTERYDLLSSDKDKIVKFAQFYINVNVIL